MCISLSLYICIYIYIYILWNTLVTRVIIVYGYDISLSLCSPLESGTRRRRGGAGPIFPHSRKGRSTTTTTTTPTTTTTTATATTIQVTLARSTRNGKEADSQFSELPVDGCGEGLIGPLTDATHSHTSNNKHDTILVEHSLLNTETQQTNGCIAWNTR